MARELTLLGAGVGAIDHLIVRRDVAQGRLVPVVPDWELAAAPVQLFTVSRFTPARVRLFGDLLAARIGGTAVAGPSSRGR